MNNQNESKNTPTFLIADEAKLLEVIGRVVDERLEKIIPLTSPNKDPVPLEEYIPKSAVRGKLFASSTLWKHERKGSLKTYAIGGKRYYKRSQIENLIQEVKQ
ncbi:MAG: hypothetical protein IPL92_01745 [Saprospiraceae bacterium]|nr:hypothetical protein [Candidatus Opimibacter iunctus]